MLLGVSVDGHLSLCVLLVRTGEVTPRPSPQVMGTQTYLCTCTNCRHSASINILLTKLQSSLCVCSSKCFSLLPLPLSSTKQSLQIESVCSEISGTLKADRFGPVPENTHHPRDPLIPIRNSSCFSSLVSFFRFSKPRCKVAMPAWSRPCMYDGRRAISSYTQDAQASFFLQRQTLTTTKVWNANCILPLHAHIRGAHVGCPIKPYICCNKSQVR